MKAMVMVAHPDDCVIFAYGYVYNHPEYSWTICYLTYTQDHARAQEFITFWQRRNVLTKFLGYPDQWNHEHNCPGEINSDQATQDIQQVIADQDLVITHGANGEYGHPHHVLVHQATAVHPHRITFAAPGQGNLKYSVDALAYDLSELPMHRDIIVGFHSTHHTNEYHQ